MLLLRLRDETRALHAEVEALVPMLAPSLQLDVYREFLAALWGVHRPLEEQLGGVDGLRDAVPDLEQRFKSEALAADLAALGIDAEQLSVTRDGPALDSIARALGCMYVLEGSTLGGQHIHRHLRVVLPVAASEASRFLTCYGAATGRMWNSFREHVERIESDLDADASVDAALRTFAAVKERFQELAS